MRTCRRDAAGSDWHARNWSEADDDTAPSCSLFGNAQRERPSRCPRTFHRFALCSMSRACWRTATVSAPIPQRIDPKNRRKIHRAFVTRSQPARHKFGKGSKLSRAYITGPEQPNVTIKMAEKQAIAGAAIGILVLDLWYPYVPGNVANASTYKYPVQFKILKGSTIPQIMRADPVLLDMIVEGGRELIRQGAALSLAPAAISQTINKRQPRFWMCRFIFQAFCKFRSWEGG